MIFKPEKYAIPDEAMKPFIDPDEINGYLQKSKGNNDVVIIECPTPLVECR